MTQEAWAIKEVPRLSGTVSVTVNGDIESSTFAPDGTGWFSGGASGQRFNSVASTTLGVTGGMSFNLLTGERSHANYLRFPVNGSPLVISDNNGGWFVQTSAGTINEVTTTTVLMHILSDGTLDSVFAARTTSPSAMVLASSTLYIAGSFTEIDGQPRNRLAAFNKTTGALLPWNPGVNSTVNTIALDPTGSTSTVYVGGSFTTSSDASGNQYIRRRAVAFDESGQINNDWNPDIGNTVQWIILDPTGTTSSVFIAGGFTTTTASSTTNYVRNNFAVFDKNGGLVSDWVPSFSGTVYAMAFDRANVTSSIFIVGQFTTVSSTNSLASTTVSKAVAIDRSGNLVTSWLPLIEATVSEIAVATGTVYMASNFSIVTSTNGTVYYRNNAVAVNFSGEVTDWKIPTLGPFYSMALSGNTVFLAGQAVAPSSERAYDIYSLNSDGSLNTTFGLPHVSSTLLDDFYGNGDVYAVAYDKRSDLVYIGGSFQAINGVARNNVAALDRNGNVTSWNPGANGIVWSIGIDPTGATTSIFLGGDFVDIASTTRQRVAAVDPNGVVTNWNPGASSTVKVITFAPSAITSSIFLGGTFTKVADTTRNRVAAVDRNGVLVSTFNPNVGSALSWMSFDPSLSTSSLFLCGSFTTVSGTTRNKMAAVDMNGRLTNWNPNGQSTVDKFVIVTGTVFVSGDFTSIGGATRSKLAALNISTGTAQNWNPNAAGNMGGIIGFSNGRLLASCGTSCSGSVQGVIAFGVVDFDASLLSFTSTTYSVPESSATVTMQFVVNTTSTDDITFYITPTGGSAVSSTDYTYNFNGISTTIAAGNTTASVQFTVVDDADSEGDETVIFSISDYSGTMIPQSASSTIIITIADNEEVESNNQNGGGYSPPLISSGGGSSSVIAIPSTSTPVAETVIVIPITFVTSTVNVVTPTSTPIAIFAEKPKKTAVAAQEFFKSTRNFSRGMRGREVRQIQQLLNSHGFIISKTGAGSPGLETDFFGFSTEQAVRRFQEAYRRDILVPVGLQRATGVVGQLTRKKLLSLH